LPPMLRNYSDEFVLSALCGTDNVAPLLASPEWCLRRAAKIEGLNNT
jgi:hypothetical protein